MLWIIILFTSSNIVLGVPVKIWDNRIDLDIAVFQTCHTLEHPGDKEREIYIEACENESELRNSSLKFHGPFSDGLHNTRNSALLQFQKN